MNYAINYKIVNGGYGASFPDFPDIELSAPTVEALEKQAYEALVEKLMSYMEAGIAVPVPVAIPNPSYMGLLPSVAPKVLLHNLVVKHNKSRSWVAAQMGVTRQVMTRLFNLRETTKVETIQNALNTLGYELLIQIQPTSSASSPI
jgi:antitoxin HicB